VPDLDRRSRVLAAALVLAAVVALAVWRWLGSAPEPAAATLEQDGAAVEGLAEVPGSDQASPVAEAAPAAPVPVATVTVHVVGPVARPGVVTLPAGSRVQDAVAAAGGFLPGFGAQALNLARLLVDGERVDTSAPAAAGPVAAEGSAATAPAADGPVDLNAATLEQLDALPGIGPVMAQRILDHRSDHGPFRTIEELAEVPGIGERRLADLRDRLRVGP
jgi:competence protein ComEA